MARDLILLSMATENFVDILIEKIQGFFREGHFSLIVKYGYIGTLKKSKESNNYSC